MAKKRPERKQEVNPGLKLLFAPKNEEQVALLKTISDNTITFVQGPAGCGKSFVPLAYALQKLLHNKYERIILVRPIVEGGGEKLGFLPGELMDKVKSYFNPMTAIFLQLIESPSLKLLMGNNDSTSKIQIVPLAYMRGLTISNSVLVFDEAQNSTIEQMRMLLTRIGEKSKFVICGDIEQSDIYQKSGLEASFEMLQGIDGIGFVTMTEESIVRHPLIRKMEERFRKSLYKKDRIKSRGVPYYEGGSGE